MNHTPHILASVFLCGLWLPFWALMAITHNEPWHCQFCGYTAADKYLRDPGLWGREIEQAKERGRLVAQRRIDRKDSTLQERAAYFVSDIVGDHGGLAVAGGVAIVAVVAIAIALPSVKRIMTASFSRRSDSTTRPSRLRAVRRLSKNFFGICGNYINGRGVSEEPPGRRRSDVNK